MCLYVSSFEQPGARLHESPVYSGKDPELLQVAQQNRFVELLVVNDEVRRVGILESTIPYDMTCVLFDVRVKSLVVNKKVAAQGYQKSQPFRRRVA